MVTAVGLMTKAAIVSGQDAGSEGNKCWSSVASINSARSIVVVAGLFEARHLDKRGFPKRKMIFLLSKDNSLV